ncbi:endothelin-converting enzyme homolog, partial [Paramuricea clavata]
MAGIPFGLLEPETRKPSKVRLVIMVLFVVLLVLSVVFISLYAVERNKSSNEGSTKQQGNDTNPTTSLSPNTTTQPATGTPRHSTTAKPTKTCSSPACIISAADILNKLDESTKPCDDFYQYSCGGFLKKTRLPDNTLYMDSTTVTTDYVQYSLRDLLQNERLMSNYSEGSAVYKAFTYYKSCLDESWIKIDGIKPLLDVIEKYGSWNITNRNWNGDSWILEKILARVLVDLKTPVFLALDIKPSYFNTSEIFVTIGGGYSGYDERLVDKKKSRSRLSEKHSEVEDFDIYKDYKTFMSTVFKLLGSNSTVDEEVNRIVDLEKGFMAVDEFFNPYDVKTLRKNVKFMTVNELNNLTSFKFNWTMYFEQVLHGTNKSLPASDQKLMILLPDAVKNIVSWLVDKPK